MGITGIRKLIEGRLGKTAFLRWRQEAVFDNSAGVISAVIVDAMHSIFRLPGDPFIQPQFIYELFIGPYLRFANAHVASKYVVFLCDTSFYVPSEKRATQRLRDERDAADVVETKRNKDGTIDFSSLKDDELDKVELVDDGVLFNGEKHRVSIHAFVRTRKARPILYRYITTKLLQETRIPSHCTFIFEYKPAVCSVFRSERRRPAAPLAVTERTVSLPEAYKLGEADLKIIVWTHWLWSVQRMPCLVQARDGDMYPLLHFHFFKQLQMTNGTMPDFPCLLWMPDKTYVVDVQALIRGMPRQLNFMRACLFMNTDYVITDVLRGIGISSILTFFQSKPDSVTPTNTKEEYVERVLEIWREKLGLKKEQAPTLDKLVLMSKKQVSGIKPSVDSTVYAKGWDEFNYNYHYWTTLDNQADALTKTADADTMPDGLRDRVGLMLEEFTEDEMNKMHSLSL